MPSHRRKIGLALAVLLTGGAWTRSDTEGAASLQVPTSQRVTRPLPLRTPDQVLALTQVLPDQPRPGGPVRVSFQLKNNLKLPVSGVVVGTIDKSWLRYNGSTKLVGALRSGADSTAVPKGIGCNPGTGYDTAAICNLAPGGTAEGILFWNSASVGVHDLDLQFGSYTAGKFDVAATLEGRLPVHPSESMLSTIDALPNLASANTIVTTDANNDPTNTTCGGGFLSGADVQWKQPLQGVLISATGTAYAPHGPTEDLRFNHPFFSDLNVPTSYFDFIWFLRPDGPWKQLVNIERDCSLTDADPDYCKTLTRLKQLPDWSKDDRGLLETEIQQGLLPESYRPDERDRVVQHGAWVIDCGHDFHTEMHPPTVVARARLAADGTGLEASVLAIPYRTLESYHGTNDGSRTDGDTFRSYVISKAYNLTIGKDLEIWPIVLPFEKDALGPGGVVHYRMTAPLKPGTSWRSSYEELAPPTLRYHFVARPGISIVATLLNSYQADFTIMVSANYTPAQGQTCQEAHISPADIENDMSVEDSAKGAAGRYHLGTLFSGLLSFALPGQQMASLLAGNAVSIPHCTVPGPAPLSPFSIYDNQIVVRGGQVYPFYGWAKFQY